MSQVLQEILVNLIAYLIFTGLGWLYIAWGLFIVFRFPIFSNSPKRSYKDWFKACVEACKGWSILLTFLYVLGSLIFYALGGRHV